MSAVDVVREVLECFYVWERSNDGAAIAEAPGVVAGYLKEHPLPVINKGDPEYLHRLTQKLYDKKLVTSCITCDNFNHELEVCKLVMRRPPALVVAKGCPSWKDDGIPF